MELQKLIDGLKAHKSGAASYESVDEAIRALEAMREVDEKKVCKGLQTAVDSDWMWRKADYIAMCCKDAIALIRQQQERIAELEAAQTARVMTLEDAAKSDVCWMEDKDMDQVMPCRIRWHYNSYFIKLFVGSPERFAKKDYGTNFRCWTQRPTDEQRKAVPWE